MNGGKLKETKEWGGGRRGVGRVKKKDKKMSKEEIEKV